jgi:hypothetical protein
MTFVAGGPLRPGIVLREALREVEAGGELVAAGRIVDDAAFT